MNRLGQVSSGPRSAGSPRSHQIDFAKAVVKVAEVGDDESIQALVESGSCRERRKPRAHGRGQSTDWTRRGTAQYGHSAG